MQGTVLPKKGCPEYFHPQVKRALREDVKSRNPTFTPTPGNASQEKSRAHAASKAAVVQSRVTRSLSSAGWTGLQPAKTLPASACWKPFFHAGRWESHPHVRAPSWYLPAFFLHRERWKRCGSEGANTGDQQESVPRPLTKVATGCSGCPRAARCPYANARCTRSPAHASSTFSPWILSSPVAGAA